MSDKDGQGQVQGAWQENQLASQCKGISSRFSRKNYLIRKAISEKS